MFQEGVLFELSLGGQVSLGGRAWKAAEPRGGVALQSGVDRRHWSPME